MGIQRCITLDVQLGFALRWLHHELAATALQDLRAKNMPFTIGNLVTARGSPAYSVALTAPVIVILLCFSIWMVRVIISTRPKSHLFDDLPTVLLYGPLYKTYCDNAAVFAMVPFFLNLGAVGYTRAFGQLWDSCGPIRPGFVRHWPIILGSVLDPMAPTLPFSGAVSQC
ncbi:hypothetical protein N7509_000412 [Penicillium cosmopolitanum]|uniref:Uncharacterized protein n=1 Tax=Penicillium cosmopolitanum TaxID=1131564 RepID=A0A9W9WA82_9EURO|nr:uncharacterized protein N7509_000412 [Penicillium cosmopolitanum]KAJ5413785.1 hypothetical protein N7509_000412 [Penicillium cosmopolitanum]